MKYRALLTEPGNTTAERPKQTLTNSWTEILSWTEKALERSTDEQAFVTHFETTERKVGLAVKAKAEEPAAK